MEERLIHWSGEYVIPAQLGEEETKKNRLFMDVIARYGQYTQLLCTEKSERLLAKNLVSIKSKDGKVIM